MIKKMGDQAVDWASSIKKANEDYKYQPELTCKLDALAGDFTETTILEIVLWKVNRYPTCTGDLLSDINDLRREYSEDKAKLLLRKLLSDDVRGFDLPMASALLRFACPGHLQMIDQRVYRLIMPDTTSLKIPHSIDKKIELYFHYLQRLKDVCSEINIPFNRSDRILYQIDKNLNNAIPIKY